MTEATGTFREGADVGGNSHFVKRKTAHQKKKGEVH